MFEISIDVLLEKADSLYKLVSVAANRAREIDRTGYLQKEENFYKTKKKPWSCFRRKKLLLD